uniref:Uncharacterized protein n=1 Tax=Knipowitschia caucasica TaxID=637954 RepID=A0AAV2MKZ5_KNICA
MEPHRSPTEAAFLRPHRHWGQDGPSAVRAPCIYPKCFGTFSVKYISLQQLSVLLILTFSYCTRRGLSLPSSTDSVKMTNDVAHSSLIHGCNLQITSEGRVLAKRPNAPFAAHYSLFI